MDSSQEREFLTLAVALGHDPGLLVGKENEEEELCAYVEVPTLEMVRSLLSRATPAQRELRQKTFFHPRIAARRRLGQGLHDRGEAVVFANGTVADEDWHGIGNHLPAHTKTISVVRKTIRTGEMWDVSVRGDVWGLDEMEELYVAVNIGVLVLEPGASLVVRGNVFSLLCQEVVARGDARVCIFPTPFSVDYGHGPMNGADGVCGSAGRSGSDGRAVLTATSILGPRLLVEMEPREMHGRPGQDGQHGTNGADGRNGGMCKIAELTFRKLDGMLSIYAQAGDGGDGGRGGDGGDGGGGGNGSDGCKLIRGVFPAGDGGSGGSGGSGGRGGHGGSGGISSNIYVNVQPGDESKIIRIAMPSKPGKGGAGGRGGAGGAAGLGGQGPESRFDGKPGKPGPSGPDGRGGSDGRSRPAPIIFLNERI